MTRQFLIDQIKSKRSYLCVGLDTDITKIPKHLQDHPDAVFEFNKQIIDVTKDLCVAYKINTAFYEVMGLKGWEAMQKTVNYIPEEHFTIADAKRGDIGNTSTQYAKAFFNTFNFDSITVAPYMGEDSIRPFLDFKNKWTIVLGLTSNKGAADFEMLKIQNGNEAHLRSDYLYENVIRKVASWGTPDNLMFVLGATQATELENIRSIIPDHFLLVPGVGFQGGSLKDVSKYGMNKDCGLLVNASRAIIYASDKENFAEEARMIAMQYQTEMAGYL
ncbi:orotidine-5'-phosphate decarboxylase [Ferruginibacter lapsinanis]|uniref:orotidine-5'-phosphate decarboxylase n=1 Tax=Ferruginibacter lapsinanis TaxID=563172 RepID=UPI001E28AFE4|nr:orotidine-5'-phosphate decarboxylase [Ferruginibacter lapsinanis]UEG50186.1 orotidine-5'-phosphate decarboxylase [Ferruginibacter lapsinanis]